MFILIWKTDLAQMVGSAYGSFSKQSVRDENITGYRNEL
jgi:hypothetical protein